MASWSDGARESLAVLSESHVRVADRARAQLVDRFDHVLRPARDADERWSLRADRAAARADTQPSHARTLANQLAGALFGALLLRQIAEANEHTDNALLPDDGPAIELQACCFVLRRGVGFLLTGFAVDEGAMDRALVRRIRAAVGPAVVNDIVDPTAQKLCLRPSEKPRCGFIDERGAAVEIDAEHAPPGIALRISSESYESSTAPGTTPAAGNTWSSPRPCAPLVVSAILQPLDLLCLPRYTSPLAGDKLSSWSRLSAQKAMGNGQRAKGDGRWAMPRS